MHTNSLNDNRKLTQCVCYMQVGLQEHAVLLVTLPGVVALTLSSLRVAPWLCRQRWAGLWHCSVPTSDEPWCCWPERLGLEWLSGGLGAWGTGTGPQGNLLLWEVRATYDCTEQIIGAGATSLFQIGVHDKNINCVYIAILCPSSNCDNCSCFIVI